MIDKIKALEKIAKDLEPDINERSKLRNPILKYTEGFLENLEDEKGYEKNPEDVDEFFNSPISEEPTDLNDLIKSVSSEVDHVGINPASGKHLGYIPGGGIYSSSLGDYWAAITNRYAGVFFANPGAVRMENQLIRWMADLAGYPDTALGNLASGGSIANLIAIVTAREAHQIKSEDIPRSVIYMSLQTHHCMKKAFKIAGLEEAIIRYVNLDPSFKMDPLHLEELVKKDIELGNTPWMVVASAGTTDVGAIDPLNHIAEVTEKYNIWFHVDGAYGAFFMLVESYKDKFKGIEKSDSVVMDPHKGLFLPYGIGVVLVKNGEPMRKAFTFEASYMQDAITNPEEISPAEVSPELTKHFRGLRMWLPLKLHGLKPFKASLEEKLLLAKYLADEIRKIDGFEVLLEPELSIVTYRYIPDNENVNDFNRRLIKEIHKDGRIFVSSTMLGDKFVLRAALLVFRTHKDTIDLYLQILKDKSEKLLREHSSVS